MPRNNRRSIRIPGYDYSQKGYYFITVCTKNRKESLGRIVKSSTRLTKIGRGVKRSWLAIPNHYPSVCLSEYVIMPNHVHGVIQIINDSVGVQNFEPLQNEFQKIIPRSLGCIIRGFKIGVTKWCRNNKISFYWQRNYYEHVIQDDEALENICFYIKNNPSEWENDIENLRNIKIGEKTQSKKYYDNICKGKRIN
jgi:REP element-mobilizing transposase RayT